MPLVIRSRAAKNGARWVTLIAIALYVILSLAYFVLGQTNTDEGWYLYASKLVFQGQLPYRDFAFTQTPLLPYIYGVAQIWRPSIALGRLVSVFVSLGTLFLSIAIARRYAGPWAGACAALFFAAFTFGIYYDTVVKTYALVSFFFVATIFVLSANRDESYKFPLAMLYACMAVLVRVTAVFFLAPIFWYVLIAARQWKTRVLVLIVAAVAGLLAGYFLLTDWQAARWGLFESHLRHWQGAQLSTQIHRILYERLPDIIQHFGLAILLFTASLYFVLRQRGSRIWRSERLPIAVAALALVLFAAAHLVNGLWQTEYLVPALIGFLPILAIVLSDVHQELEIRSRVFAQAIIGVVLVLLPLTESIQHIDFTGRRLPLAEIEQVANFVAQNSKPTDEVLALEAFGVVIEANRPVLPGTTIAQFSAQLMDTPTAERYHVVNTGMIAEMVNQGRPAVIIWTNRDWVFFQTYGATDAVVLQNAMDQKYRVGMTMDLFGGYADTVSVYLRR